VKFGVGIDDGNDRLDLEFIDVHARSRQYGETGQADGEILFIENRLALGFAHVSLLFNPFRPAPAGTRPALFTGMIRTGQTGFLKSNA
jgi:hypothetical protein